MLGSLNLSAFVTDEGKFDYAGFADAVRIATIGLNKVLDEGLDAHPLEIQRITARNWRQIGLGVFGIADMLIKMGIRYGDDASLKLCDMIGHYMINYALRTSAELARDNGTYPMYNKDAVLKSEFLLANADDTTLKLITKYGLRNSQVLTIPPCGSIATMIGVSSGIEPIYANYYTRKTESLNSEDKFYKVYTPIVEQYMLDHNLHDDSELPAYFVTSHDISPEKRIAMQCVWQKHIDASISSTINLPQEATVEEIENIYLLAWEKKLKGITVFRDNCKRVGILTTSEEITINELMRGDWESKPEDTVYHERKLNIGCGSLILFIGWSKSANKIIDVFVEKSGQGGCEKLLKTVAISMSAIFRLGGGIDNVERAMEGISACPSFVAARKDGRKLSKGNHCGAAILNALKDFTSEMLGTGEDKSTNDSKPKCPECGEPLIFEGGCNVCKNCGWSKCG